MTDERLAELGRFISSQRKRAHLSVRKLSEMAGVSNPYLSQIERGLRKPSADILQQLAKALSISAETLYVQAGMLDDEKDRPRTTLVERIQSASDLTEAQRATLLHIYESFLTANAAESSDASVG